MNIEERVIAKLRMLNREYEKYKAKEDYEATSEILPVIDLLEEILYGGE